jgi:RHH-type proline utilization regulon transcriptional repressor/proline dehydrogenase/delta 1-pyrroline-5-carboxylate dehydrogenase
MSASRAVPEAQDGYDTLHVGRRFLERARHHQRAGHGLRFYHDKLIGAAMADPTFKVQLFRFIDCFPTLSTPQDVYAHLAEYLDQPGVRLPRGLEVGLRAGRLAPGAMAAAVSAEVRAMAGQFIAGADARAALDVLRRGWDHGRAFSVDLLGEVCVSDAEADAYLARYLATLDDLADATAAWPARPLLEADALGPVPRVNLSLKLSALSARLRPADPEASLADLRPRLALLAARAEERGAALNLDMETAALQEIVLAAALELCASSRAPIGVALQAYRTSGRDDARSLARWARESGHRLGVRLVKGAYWDYETTLAEMNGWPSPLWPTKPETDACFEDMARLLLEAWPRRPGDGGIRLAVGSHNVRSVCAALAAAEELGVPTGAVELQMLHGMADPLKAAAADLGLRLREYVPLGELVPGMAYLVRRLLENTSNESWLRADLVDHAGEDHLLADPRGLIVPAAPADPAARHALSPAVAGLGDGRPFTNEPPRDFSRAEVRAAFAAAVARTPRPPQPPAGDVAAALATAAASSWGETPALERAALLVRAAALLRERRDALSALVIVEAGKTWAEADADVCEAIDFCEYYARCAAALFEPRRLGRFTGELDTTWYEPRGVAAVIAPWNFPAAIACGMTTAALVCGNATILKPAGQTTGIAAALVDALHHAGVPRDALQLLPGPGATVGAELVRDPRVAIIAFTGSRKVGFDILAAAGAMTEGQAGIKKTILELGGKNAIVVDSSADLDEAVLGVRASAFGYQGQKCSACSRVIVVDHGAGLWETFLRRLGEATAALSIGDARDPGTMLGPVIDAAAKKKIEGYIARGRDEARLLYAGEVPDGLEARTGRDYVAPHIFADVPRDSVLWREEIFGPVLACRRAASFAEALAEADECAYRLTGGVYSRTPSHLEQARRKFRVGNLYLNRAITGALVGRQPFGGLGHSGVGSKAGGADYLLQFCEPRSCCENTLRHGFAPEP